MKSEIKCAVFDLDGTLVNTIDDLARACEILIDKYSFPAHHTIEEYTEFVGSGAKNLVAKAFNLTLDEKTLEERYEEFKPIYDSIKLDNAKPYDGITEQLDILKSKGVKLCVVSNKPDKAAKGMVRHIFGNEYFDYIIGHIDSDPIKPDPTTLKKALHAVGCSAKEAIYFGDSEIDVRTAKNAGVEAIACSWGYRSFSTLFNENPDAVIDKPDYISKLF